MKAVANPFAPGAGAPPQELARRDSILNDATLAIQRNKGGKSARSFIYVGLRGVGKTVLLNEVQAIAERENCLLYTSPSPRDRTRSRMPSSA